MKKIVKQQGTSCLCAVLLVVSMSGTACFRTPLGSASGLTPDGSAGHLDAPNLIGAKPDLALALWPDVPPDLLPPDSHPTCGPVENPQR